MHTFKYIKGIFPQELLKDIQETVSKFPYTKAPETVSAISEQPEDIDIFKKFINQIDTIQDIEPNICILYNNSHNGDSPENFKFSFSEAAQIHAAFEYYMPEEFNGYTLSRMHANYITRHSDYPVNKYTVPHYDFPTLNYDPEQTEYKTILFYVNTSDGNTILFDVHSSNQSYLDPLSTSNISNIELKIAHEQTPVENCALIYSSGRLHAQRPNVMFDKRFVINIVLKKNVG